MKILFCTNSFQNITNGPAKFANLLLQINQLKEHELHILTEDVEYSSPYVHKIRIKYPGFLSLLSQFFRMWQYHRAAKSFVEREGFDVVVYNNALIGLISSFGINTLLYGMINDDNNVLNAFHFNYLEIKRAIFKIVERIAARKIDYILVNSSYLRRLIISKYKLNKDKVFVLYKGIEESLVYNVNISFTKEENSILFVKSDFVRGGLYILLEALNLIQLPLNLVVIGPPVTAHPHIVKLSFNKGKICLLENQPQSNVYLEMQKTQIFCVPSYKEALGVANIEALAFGCAVISTNVGGIPEVLDNGKNGWMVPPGDPVALSAAIQEALDNPQLRAQKINNGREYIKKFSAENAITKFLKILSN